MTIRSYAMNELIALAHMPGWCTNLAERSERSRSRYKLCLCVIGYIMFVNEGPFLNEI